MDSVLPKPVNLDVFGATNREECGVLVKTCGEIVVVRVENAAVNDDDYAILMQDFKEVLDGLEPGDEVIGFFHTHLPHHSCEPSDSDFEGAKMFPEFNNLIYKPDTKEFVWYGSPDGVGN